ncbi:MAG: hypothetical protein OXC17_10690 [Aestuariivita sp.]|nr:hypothetical protein [Aestuariivita sp.]
MAYSIWLNFNNQCVLKLKNRIQTIAHRYSCPEFHPHLTLVGDLDIRLDEARKVAKMFVDKVIPPTISVRSVDSSDRYFMALFLTLDIPSELQETRKRAARFTSSQRYNLDDPHVSIAYGHLNQHDLAKEVEILTRDFLNNRLIASDISVVHSSKNVPISDWQPVETIGINHQATERNAMRLSGGRRTRPTRA